MPELIAYCGLNCSGCPIYLAMLETDKSKQKLMRIAIAKECSELYHMELKPEDVTDCDGCIANTGRLFSGCVNCNIRACAKEKGVENCARCLEYVCGNLMEMFVHDPDAKTRLDEIRKGN